MSDHRLRPFEVAEAIAQRDYYTNFRSLGAEHVQTEIAWQRWVAASGDLAVEKRRCAAQPKEPDYFEEVLRLRRQLNERVEWVEFYKSRCKALSDKHDAEMREAHQAIGKLTEQRDRLQRTINIIALVEPPPSAAPGLGRSWIDLINDIISECRALKGATL